MSNGGAGIASTGGETTGPMAVIELLADGPRLKKLYKEYEDRTKDYNALLSQVGPAQDVVRLRKELAAELAGVPDLKIQAHAEATAIVTAANKEASEIKAKAKSSADATKAAAAKVETKASETEAAANAKLESVRNMEADVIKREQRVVARENTLKNGVDNLNQEKAQLQADRDRLAEALKKAQALLQ